LQTLDAYNTSLTKTVATALTQSGQSLGAASTGTVALFAGGEGGSATVSAYNSSLTKLTSPTALSQGREYPHGVSNSLYMFFTGGYSGSALATVDAYDTSLTRYAVTGLNGSSYTHGTATINDYAYVTTGVGYNTSLTRVSLGSVSGQFYNWGSNIKFGDGAAFGASNTMTYVNKNFTQATFSGLTSRGGPYAGASVAGQHAIFAGGIISNAATNLAEVYSISLISNSYLLTTPTLSDFTITYDYTFTNIGTGTVGEGATLSSSTTFTGFLEIPEEVT
jgi:hypothetical protein